MKTKLTIDQKGLKQALGILATVVPSKSSMPILSNVLLSYNNDRRQFALGACDGEKWLTVDCIDSDGKPFVHLIEDDHKDPFTAVCINFSDLREAIALLPAGQLLQATFDDASHTLLVDYQIGQFTMPFEVAVEWPKSPEVAAMGSVGALLRTTIKTAQLLPYVKQARTCVASDELRPVMETVCLDISHEGMTIVATDGHQLYKRSVQIGAGWLQYGLFDADKSVTLLMHKSALQALEAAFAPTEEVTLTADAQRAEWRAGGITMVCRLPEGRYPNYNSVIPTDNPHRVEVDVRSLSAALRRLRLFANDSSNMGTLKRDGGTLIIEAEDADFSKRGNEHVSLSNAADCSLPDGFKIGFKIATMLDLLSVVSTELALVYIADPQRAMIIKEDARQQDLTLLIMPMML